MIRILGNLFMAINIGSSVVMALYAYSVLWGTVYLGIFQIPMRAPTTISFKICLYEIALPGALYSLSQAIGPLMRSPANVWLYLLAVLTSFASAGVVGYAVLQWMFGAYVPTQYQMGGLVLWGVAVLIDLVVIGVGARFLQRSWLGEGVGH